MQEDLNAVYGVDVHESTLCVFLKKNGFTRQRMKIVAARQDQLLREMFVVDVQAFNKVRKLNRIHCVPGKLVIENTRSCHCYNG